MVSEAQKRATKNYEKEKIDKVTLRLEKGKKEIYRSEAEKRNISLNAFIVEAIEEKIKNDWSIYCKTALYRRNKLINETAEICHQLNIKEV